MRVRFNPPSFVLRLSPSFSAAGAWSDTCSCGWRRTPKIDVTVNPPLPPRGPLPLSPRRTLAPRPDRNADAGGRRAAPREWPELSVSRHAKSLPLVIKKALGLTQRGVRQPPESADPKASTAPIGSYAVLPGNSLRHDYLSSGRCAAWEAPALNPQRRGPMVLCGPLPCVPATLHALKPRGWRCKQNDGADGRHSREHGAVDAATGFGPLPTHGAGAQRHGGGWHHHYAIGAFRPRLCADGRARREPDPGGAAAAGGGGGLGCRAAGAVICARGAATRLIARLGHLAEDCLWLLASRGVRSPSAQRKPYLPPNHSCSPPRRSRLRQVPPSISRENRNL